VDINPDDDEVSPNSDMFRYKVLKSIFEKNHYDEYNLMTKKFTFIINKFFVNQLNLIGAFNSFSHLLFNRYVKVGYKLEQSISRLIGGFTIIEVTKGVDKIINHYYYNKKTNN